MESFDRCAMSFILKPETLQSILKRRTIVRVCLIERIFFYLESYKKAGRSKTSDKVVVVYQGMKIC